MEEGKTTDSVAVQFPTGPGEGFARPYFLEGDPGHPVNLWRWTADGMGKACGRTYAAITQPMPTTDLAARLGVTPRAVRHQLARLMAAGLVVRDGRVWRRTERTVEDVLATRAVRGERDRQRARHEDDRVRYSEHLARRAEATEWYERLARAAWVAKFERWWEAFVERFPPRAADLTDNDYGDTTRIVETAATMLVVEEEAGGATTARTERLDGAP
jgi:DNA-binding transcriptional ArsR family regulator